MREMLYGVPIERESSEITGALEALGVPKPDAAVVAEALLAADLRGRPSHGTARLPALLEALHRGEIVAAARPEIVRDTPASITIDAHNGLGHPAAKLAMTRVIEKAREAGAAFGTVRGSNDFGIAGYYAMLAVPHDMIGIAMTNAPRVAVPTYGKDVLLGSNPMAFAAPANAQPPFVLDFSTTTVQRSEIERRAREGRPLAAGWATDETGRETLDPVAALRGALLPLGGAGTARGGHKGYGLSLLVDILCGVLSGGAFGTGLPRAGDPDGGGKLSHFFGAIRIDGFRDPEGFKDDMDALSRDHQNSEKAREDARIYLAGQIASEAIQSKQTL